MAVRITGAGVALTVGIIVVTGLIIGGFFWARQSGEQARNDEAAQIAREQLEEQSNEEVALNDGDENTDENKDENEGESQTNGTEQGTTNESTDDIPATGADTDDASVEELPQTGPADTSAVFVLALLAFSVTSYIVSRRHISS